MTYAQFARQLRPLVETLGAVRAAEVCGVTKRTINLWLAGHGNPNLATQTGALFLLQMASRRSPSKGGHS